MNMKQKKNENCSKGNIDTQHNMYMHNYNTLILFDTNNQTDKKCPFCSPSLHFPTKNVLIVMDGIFMIQKKNFADR